MSPIVLTAASAFSVATLAYIAGALISLGVIGKSLHFIWKKTVLFAQVLTEIRAKLPVLTDIANQFKTNHGSSLRDVVNELLAAVQELMVAARENREGVRELRDAAAASKVIVDELQAAVRTMRELDREGRKQLIEMLRSNFRIEAATQESADADAVVAGDLAASQRRADAVLPEGAPGAAADAASRPPSETSS